MQFFNTVYLAVKQSRPLIQNYRISLPSEIQNHVLRPSCRPFSSQSADEQGSILANLPEKPKRPASVYLRYIQSIEPTLIKEFPGIKRTALIKLAAEMYRKADKEVVRRFQNAYADEQKQYNEKLAEYKSSLTEEQKTALAALKVVEKQDKQRRQTKKLERESNKPKRPVNAYMIYSQERREQEPHCSDVTEWTKKISVEWKSLPEEEKKKYTEKYDKAVLQYEAELSKWQASIEGTEYSHLLPKLKESDDNAQSTKSKSKVSKKTVSSAQKGKVPQNKK